MSHQINLHDPSLRRQRHWLTAANLAFALVMIAACCSAGAHGRGSMQAAWPCGLRRWMSWPRRPARNRWPWPADWRAASQTRDWNSISSPRRDLLDIRQGVLDKLGEGAAPAVGSHAEYLRGLARQSLNGL